MLYFQKVEGDISDVSVTTQEVGNSVLARQDFVLSGPHETGAAWVAERVNGTGGCG